MVLIILLCMGLCVGCVIYNRARRWYYLDHKRSQIITEDFGSSSQIQKLVQRIVQQHVPGCIVVISANIQTGLWIKCLLKYNHEPRKLWLFDASDNTETTRDNYKLFDETVHIIPGPVKHTLRTATTGPIALLYIDTDSSDTARFVLEAYYDRVVHGGHIAITHYLDHQLVVKEFREARDINVPLRDAQTNDIWWQRS